MITSYLTRIVALEARVKRLEDALIEAEFGLYRANFRDAKDHDYSRCLRALEIVKKALKEG